MGMLVLLTYIFLLRVPSEALPAHAHLGGHSVLSIENGRLVLALQRRLGSTCVLFCFVVFCYVPRKIERFGSGLTPGCWCTEFQLTCPIHVLGAFLDRCPAGHKIFAGITAARATRTVRVFLKFASIPEYETYRLHDLRRGHAQDLQQSGASLAEILAAGEWRSAMPAHMDRSARRTGRVCSTSLA